jgi:hypothetical protein
MSNRFALFLFAAWCPLLLLGGGVLGELYLAEFGALGATKQMVLIYAYVLTLFAPLIWKAFLSKF